MRPIPRCHLLVANPHSPLLYRVLALSRLSCIGLLWIVSAQNIAERVRFEASAYKLKKDYTSAATNIYHKIDLRNLHMSPVDVDSLFGAGYYELRLM